MTCESDDDAPLRLNLSSYCFYDSLQAIVMATYTNKLAFDITSLGLQRCYVPSFRQIPCSLVNIHTFIIIVVIHQTHKHTGKPGLVPAAKEEDYRQACHVDQYSKEEEGEGERVIIVIIIIIIMVEDKDAGTYTPTYLPTYIPTHPPTYLPTYRHHHKGSKKLGGGGFCLPGAKSHYSPDLMIVPIHKGRQVGTYIHTYIPTKIHTYIHTYRHTEIHTYNQTYAHTYEDRYIHTYIRTYIHTYIHTYRHP